ncbi:MAG: S41 family peptidase [Armatimonadota bacterium]
MRSYAEKARNVVLVLAIFLGGLGVGLTVAGVTNAAADEAGLSFAARVAQVLPGVYTIGEGKLGTGTNLQPLSIFWEVREQIKRHFVHKIDEQEDKEMTYGAIRGMLAALDDPYTRFYTPEAYQEFESDSSGRFEGIGAVLEPRAEEGEGDLQDKLKATISTSAAESLPEDMSAEQREELTAAVAQAIFARFITVEKSTLVVINSVIPGGPADQAGLLPGDTIIQVDDQPIKGMHIGEVVKLIRGPGGTKVTLTVVREGEQKPIPIDITRDTVDVPIVDYQMLEDKIGHVWLHTFNERAAAKVREAIGDLQAQGMRGLILDLTDDPGGLLDVAVKVGEIFVDGPVVWIEERGGQAQSLDAAAGRQIEETLPIVVLINRGSASASEIVAGAIQDNERGTIAGQASFGKAKVQTVIKLHDESAIAITTANYLTPKKRDIDGHGITPDQVIPDPPNKADMKAEDVHNHMLAAAVKIMKKKLARAGRPGAGREG